MFPFQVSPGLTDEEKIKKGEKCSFPPHVLQVRHPLSGHVVAAPEHQAKVAFRMLSETSFACSSTQLLLWWQHESWLFIRYFGFSAFLIPDICSLFFSRDKERDILLPRERHTFSIPPNCQVTQGKIQSHKVWQGRCSGFPGCAQQVRTGERQEGKKTPVQVTTDEGTAKK